MDYGKYKYQLHKKQQQAKSKQRAMRVKEIRIRPLIEEHDLQVKLKQARKFIDSRQRIVVNMIFRGREFVHRDLGQALLERFAGELADIARLETPIHLEGKKLSMTLLPK